MSLNRDKNFINKAREFNKLSQSTSGINSACGENELVFVGGIESNKWLDDGKSLSRNFKQGYRVYDSNGIACSLTTNGGGFGSHTGLYLIEK